MHKLKSHLTVDQIAKKHRLDVSFVKNQLKMGIPIEHEHTKDKDLATDIALQHLDEIPDYYTRLKKMEASAKKEHKKFKDVSEGTLHHWFKGSRSKDGKPGWVQADGSPCANEPGETKTPKCFSSGRLKSLKKKGKKGKALIRSAIRRKRQKDKFQQSKTGASKPTNVPTFAKGKKDPNYVKAEPGIKEAMEINEARKDRPGKGSGSKDACYHKVKNRVKVWPSAYASGQLVQCRKRGASNWGTQTEAINMRYCPKCKKDEVRDECKYGTKFWDMYSMPIKLKDYTPNTPHPGNFPESYDHEHSMARSELSTIVSAAKRLRKKMKGEGNIEAWVQSKITKAADYLDSAADYVDSGEMKVDEAMNPSFEIKGGKSSYSQPVLPGEQRLLPQYQKKEPEPTQIIKPGLIKQAKKKTTNLQVAHYEINGEMIDEKCWSGYVKKGMKTMFGKKYPNCVKSEGKKTFGQFMIEASPAWQRKEGKNPKGGLNKKGIASYRKENPGSKLSMAVTTPPSKLKPGSKAAKRRKSFCARMGGMPGPMKDEKGRPTRKALSLRKWNC